MKPITTAFLILSTIMVTVGVLTGYYLFLDYGLGLLGGWVFNEIIGPENAPILTSEKEKETK